MPRGLAPRSASTPVACPRTPYGGRFPESHTATPARVVQSIVIASPPLPLAGNGQKAVRMDGESAPVATSRRGWFRLRAGEDTGPYPNPSDCPGGRILSAPTQSLLPIHGETSGLLS